MITVHTSRKLFIMAVVMGLLIAQCLCGYAQTSDKAKVQSATKQMFGANITLDNVKFNEEIKMYQVEFKGNYMFLTPDMKYAFIGDIINVQTKQNIIQPPQVEFSSLPVKDAVVLGSGKNKVALFMDSRCPHCHKQYNDLAKNKDITAYIYLFPSPDMEKVWCSSDKAGALDKAINGKSNNATDATKCETSALTRNHALSRSFMIRSIPTIIYTDGSRTVGYVSPEAFQQKLTEVAAVKGK